MAPLASDPRQLLVVLNPARRKALYTLVSDITAYMRSQLELDDSQQQQPQAPGAAGKSSGDAPLFAQPPPVPSSPDDDDAGPDSGLAAAAASPNSSSNPALVSQRITPPTPQLIQLRRAAIAHLDAWRKEVLTKLREIAAAPDDAKVLDERRKRGERLAREKAQTAGPGENLIDFGGDGAGAGGGGSDEAGAAAARAAAAVEALQRLYHPIPTRLATLPEEDRAEALSCVLLLALASGAYVGHSRALALYLCSALALPVVALVGEETAIATSLVEASAEAAQQQQQGGGMSADAEAQKRKQEGQTGRYWKVGLSAVAGAALIGVTGGLAAPVVAGAIGGLMGTVGLGGVASFLGIFWMNGALVGTLFGAFGARMTGGMVDQYAREVEDFKFLPLKDEWGREYSKETDKDVQRRLRVTIGVNGWLTSKDDITRPWRCLGDESEVFALRYEMDSLLELGKSLEGMVSSYAWSFVKLEILKRTVLATLWSALWPVYLLKMAANIDNPFNLARNRSEKAGKILADALINKVQGERPVTLVGYSLGARVIYTCLRSLVERKAFGLVDTVVFIGAPIPSNRVHFQMMRSVVSGKIFNVFSENDYILAFMYRATSIQLGVAGLQEIRDVEGVENVNLTEEVKGHLRYPDLIPQILTRCGFPNVKGGDAPIEKEKDEIAIEDADGSQVGTLIELDDLAISDPPTKPPRPSLTESASQPAPTTAAPRSVEQLKARTTVARAKSTSLVGDGDPLAGAGSDPLRIPSPPVPEVSVTPRRSSRVIDLGPLVGASHGDSAEPRIIHRKAPSVTLQRKPVLPKRPEQPVSRPVPQPHDTDDDDDSDHGGIKMVDNDEELAFAEPIPMDD